MTRRDALRNIALVAALIVGAMIAVIGSTWYFSLVPYKLRVAVSPAKSELAQFFVAFAKILDREKAPVRLTVVAYADSQQTAASIDAGNADLAVVRSDFTLPAFADGVAILHQMMIVLAARDDTGIVRFSDLRGRKVGVLSQGTANNRLFERLAAFYELSAETITIVPFFAQDEVAKAAASRQIDALFIVGPRDGRAINEAIKSFRDALGSAPALIPIHDAPKLTRLNPIFTAAQIAPGEIQVTPALPAEEIATVVFPALIVAHRNLASKAVYEFTKQLFTLRQILAAQHVAAARIEALPTERGSPFSVHPGAETYYDATETGFLDKYSDYLWLALFGFGGLVSLVTWLFGPAFPKRCELMRSEYAELVTLVDAAREAPTFAAINAIERRIDQLVVQTSGLIFDGGIDSNQQPAFDLLLVRLAAILEGRRREIAEDTGP